MNVLHKAAKNGLVGILKMLISFKSTRINEKNIKGLTALHICC